ncbi:MAG: hypothetical protein NTV34_08010, partial [Proteobacteria bacterium]|nr:hypothetical protein [Pseudomonadota bacterium]
VSKLPVYKEGVFTLEIQYGSRFFSSTKISAEKCNDSFESKGKAVLEEYVGGFAGTKQSRLICTCELL